MSNNEEQNIEQVENKDNKEIKDNESINNIFRKRKFRIRI